MDSILAFTGIAALLTLSPGPDMAVMLRNVLRAGTPAVLPTALGIVTGLGAWAIASAIGISALVASSPEAYASFRLAGAACLAGLGLVALRHALGPHAGRHAGALESPAAHGPGSPTLVAGAAFRLGLLTNLSNPKVGIFYATLLPQFIPPGAPVLGTSLLLAGIHAALGLAWLSVYGRAVDRLAGALAGGMGRRLLEGFSGTVLLALGARAATGA